MKISESRGKRLVGIAIRNVVGTFNPRWTDLKRAFHLTQAEDQVVKSLLGGSSAEQIAEMHGLSLDTIRTHIRHAYDKLQVSSREQMWHRLAPYRLN
ncbi:MAG TPA: helix-turn-helix transcriptional regulator [Allosphingosinicella sp.]